MRQVLVKEGTVKVKGVEGLRQHLMMKKGFTPIPPFMATDVECDHVPLGIDHSNVHFKGESSMKKEGVEAKMGLPTSEDSPKPSKKKHSEESLAELTKDEQVKLLKKLGVSDAKMPKNEAGRIKKILDLQG